MQTCINRQVKLIQRPIHALRGLRVWVSVWAASAYGFRIFVSYFCLQMRLVRKCNNATFNYSRIKAARRSPVSIFGLWIPNATVRKLWPAGEAAATIDKLQSAAVHATLPRCISFLSLLILTVCYTRLLHSSFAFYYLFC